MIVDLNKLDSDDRSDDDPDFTPHGSPEPRSSAPLYTPLSSAPAPLSTSLSRSSPCLAYCLGALPPPVTVTITSGHEATHYPYTYKKPDLFISHFHKLKEGISKPSSYPMILQ